MSEGSSSTAPRRQSTTPYARQDPNTTTQHKQPKSSSTTALFNTRKNWSQYILESIEDFMHVISTDGTFIFASPSVDTLCGYDPEELRGQNFFSFLHPSDVEPFKREFFQCLASPKNSSPATCATNPERLTAHYRFRTKDDRHVLFEVTGHFFSGSTISPLPTGTASGSSSSSSMSSSSNPSPAPALGSGTTHAQPKCFFGLARPYPSRSIAMLDSFLELKMENERLRQELLVLYEEIEGDGAALSPTGLRLQQQQQQASESTSALLVWISQCSVLTRCDVFVAQRHVERKRSEQFSCLPSEGRSVRRAYFRERDRPVDGSHPYFRTHSIDFKHVRRARDRNQRQREERRRVVRETQKGERSALHTSGLHSA